MEEATDYSNNARDLFADATQFPKGSPDRIKKLKSAADAFRNELTYLKRLTPITLSREESFELSFKFVQCLYLIDEEYRRSKTNIEIADYERNYEHYIDLKKDYPLIKDHIMEIIKSTYKDEKIRNKERRKLESKHIETVYELCKFLQPKAVPPTA